MAAALGNVPVVEDVAADVGQRLGVTLPRGPQVVLREGLRVGVDHCGDGVEHGRIVEPARELAAAVPEPPQHELIHLRRRLVLGLLAVLIQQLHQVLSPAVQLGRGVLTGLVRECGLRARPLLGRQPPRS
jgi:hypothetical protein